MGMQVVSLSAGGILAAPSQDLPQEKRAPLPGEQKVSPEQYETSLPGGKSAKAPDLQQTTSELERISMAFDRRLKFEIDQQSKEILIKVIDNETDKVIKVLPPEELQRLHSRIRETFGFLFDKMV